MLIIEEEAVPHSIADATNQNRHCTGHRRRAKEKKIKKLKGMIPVVHLDGTSQNSLFLRQRLAQIKTVIDGHKP